MNQSQQIIADLNEATSTGLVSVSSDLESLRKSIEKFFGGTKITIKELENGGFEVSNSKGPLTSFRVVKKKGRFRFEEK